MDLPKAIEFFITVISISACCMLSLSPLQVGSCTAKFFGVIVQNPEIWDHFGIVISGGGGWMQRCAFQPPISVGHMGEEGRKVQARNPSLDPITGLQKWRPQRWSKAGVPCGCKWQHATQATSKTDENLKHIVSTACRPGVFRIARFRAF